MGRNLASNGLERTKRRGIGICPSSTFEGYGVHDYFDVTHCRQVGNDPAHDPETAEIIGTRAHVKIAACCTSSTDHWTDVPCSGFLLRTRLNQQMRLWINALEGAGYSLWYH